MIQVAGAYASTGREPTEGGTLLLVLHGRAIARCRLRARQSRHVGPAPRRAVNNAIGDLVTVIAGAPADPKTREAWLERLWEAHEADQIPYIERLADYWGEPPVKSSPTSCCCAAGMCATPRPGNLTVSVLILLTDPVGLL
jgi:hypothetical protein